MTGLIDPKQDLEKRNDSESNRYWRASPATQMFTDEQSQKALNALRDPSSRWRSLWASQFGENVDDFIASAEGKVEDGVCAYTKSGCLNESTLPYDPKTGETLVDENGKSKETGELVRAPYLGVER